MLIKISDLNSYVEVSSNSLSNKDHLPLLNEKNKSVEDNSTVMVNSLNLFEEDPKINKVGSVYIKCTKRNIFCTLINPLNKKVETSCSLRVPTYDNKHNERDNLYTRAVLLGKLLAQKTIDLGYKELIIYLTGMNKGQLAIIRSFSKVELEIDSIVLVTSNPHNGCRPAKVRRKKFRSKVRNTN
uniref:ribosomal protein S11 n=1 Tax=Desmarestia aculeata TaxID=62298 RepID=UPI002E75AF17|nr:ribosomal protein S11 [Desmarestia aculeata]WBP69920.1 ribosomal protein S11 [Desmarestia aculeata]